MQSYFEKQFAFARWNKRVMMTRYHKSCRFENWLLQRLLQLWKSLIFRSMTDTFNWNNWWEQLNKLKHRLRCRIFINKLRMLFRHISLRSLKSRILRSCSTLIEILIALRASSIDFISSTYSSLSRSLKTCIINKSKLNKLLIFQRKVKDLLILFFFAFSFDMFSHAKFGSFSTRTSKAFYAKSFSKTKTEACCFFAILTLDYYKDYYKYK
jgi:hypothetical protein